MNRFWHALIALGFSATMFAGPTVAAAEELTFKQVMRGLSEDMSRLGSAVFVGDFVAIEKAAAAIAAHPRPSVAERQRVMKTLGRDMPRLKEADDETHVAAVELRGAAQHGDMDGVLLNHGRLMNSCVACHTAFRHRLVTD